MGCWNKTCALSHLPILEGEQVYLFVIFQKPTEIQCYNRCYTHALWTPLALPVVCEYDGYGAAENCEPFAMNIVLNQIQKTRVPSPFSDNPIEQADELTEEAFFNAVHDGSLFVKHRFNRVPTQADFVMMRKDVVDYILKNRVYQRYVSATSTTKSHYERVKFSAIVASIPAFMKRVFTAAIASDTGVKHALSRIFINGDEEFHHPPEDGSAPLLAAHWSYMSFARTLDNFGIIDEMTKYVQDENMLLAEKLCEKIVLTSFINDFMEETRLIWVPACHEGSQQGDFDGYNLLCNAIQASAFAQEAKQGVEE